MNDSQLLPHLWEALQIVVRSAVIYGFGIAALRIGKSRSLSRATVFDALLILMLGSLLGRGLTGSIPLSAVVLSGITLVGIHWLLSYVSATYHQFGNLIKGNAKLLVEDGRIHRANMRTSHISEHDLMEEMRLNANINTLDEVAFAFKERSGDIGIVRKKNVRIVDIGVSGGVQTVRLILEQ